MRLLYIQCTSDLYGASRSLLRTTTRLVKDGHLVVVVLGEDGPLAGALNQAGIKTIIIPLDPTLRKRSFKSFKGLVGLMSACRCAVKEYVRIGRRYNVDLVYSNTSQSLPGGFVARALGVPHIFHIRESYEGFGGLWLMYRAFLLATSDKIICVSKAIADQFPLRLHGNKVITRHNGFPKDEFEPVSEERRLNFLNQFGLSEGRLLVGLIGRIILQRKGQDVFVKAVAKIRDRFPDARFMVVGSCFKGNEHHLVNLKRLIREYDLEECILLTGQVEDIKAVYAVLDISILASATPEPFGGVTIESMAMGVPVIGTAIGGTPEQIDDGISGILIPPNDEQSLADAMSRLIDDGELRRSMGHNARARFMQKFTFEPYYDEMQNILAAVTTGKRNT
jgi:glycosyltransferase involved in cell wall biosynthesis